MQPAVTMTPTTYETLQTLGFLGGGQTYDEVKSEPHPIDFAHAWHHVGDDYDDAVAHGAATLALYSGSGFADSLRAGHLCNVRADLKRWGDWTDDVRYLRDCRAALLEAATP